ncbi:MAG: diaminopimelate epimerase [Xanthomonadales bacterium PRO6]|nr:Diaminopimelate epimerase [Xanthomonadales bacterium]MCE7930349.1 diaminopimelate epimerase [Xanthomonadales bacterium PRO6]
MSLRFTKMHGAGNDFVILDRIAGAPFPDAALARRLADRRFGVGCDQIMLVEPARAAGEAFSYRILNADGSAAGQCGNGARCVARYLRARHGLADGAVLGSPGGMVDVRFLADGDIELSLGVPCFDPVAIPFLAGARQSRYPLELDGASLDVAVLSMGNPHAVLLVDDVAAADVAGLGSRIERHMRFPDRANVGFVQLVDRRHLRLRVWERGVGETLACGSGACAAMVALRIVDAIDDAVAIELPGGCLRVRWAGEGEAVFLTGPAVFVFDGELT